MTDVRPFKGWRPAPGKAERVASPPYDVLNSQEARELASGNEDSFLHIIKPEIDLKPDVDLYSDEVYGKAGSNWASFKQRGLFVQDEKPCFYFYKQSINGHSQTGIVGASAIDDYFSDKIKKHEFTRPKKENDRIAHMSHLGIHPGPVFLTYKRDDELNKLRDKYITEQEPEVDFEAEDGVRHTLWVVDDSDLVHAISERFSYHVEATYIADGHHRAAASAKVGQKMREESPRPEAHYDHFLSVLFPDEELKIIDYNRLLVSLNRKDQKRFLEEISEHFEVSLAMEGSFKPKALHEFGMYLDKQWYRLEAKSHTYDDSDPIKCLDVTVLSDYLIDPILGITDQRTDERIDFVGGIRGLRELEKRVDSGEMAVAFALYPVSVQQLIDIADAGMVMPPKSTWFEPKLRSGLVVHEFRT